MNGYNHDNGFCRECGEFTPKGTGWWWRGWVYCRNHRPTNHNTEPTTTEQRTATMTKKPTDTIFVCILETRYRIVGTGPTAKAAEHNAITVAQQMLGSDPWYVQQYGTDEHSIRRNIELFTYELPLDGAVHVN